MALIAVLLIVFCSGCGEKETPEPVADIPVGGEEGNLAPDFNLANLAGGTLQLSSLKGKAVIIDFWDTWCGPCRIALPHLNAISETYPDDLVVVGVAFARKGEAAVRTYVQDNHLTFPMVIADQDVINAFGGVRSIPTTFLIDKNGVIVKKWVGGHSRDVYENEVKKLLGS